MTRCPREWRTLRLLAMLFALSACQPAPAPPGGPPQGPPPVTVAAAVSREVLDADDFPGRIEATDSVAIRARVTGYLQTVAIHPGTEVKKGALLFEIDPRPFAARVAEAEAALANARAARDLARIEKSRQQQMLKSNATSQREVDVAVERVTSLEAGVKAAHAAIEIARINLDYCRVTAPIDGRVGKDEVTIGNLIQGDGPDSPVLTRLVSVDPVYVTFEADERAYLKYIGAARGEALTVEVGLANEDGYPHHGRLQFIDNTIDHSSGTVRMRAVLDNPDRRFTPGLFARVRLQAASGARRAVLVDDRAIGTDQSRRFVLVVGQDRKANYREVKLGRKVDGLRLIESGLEADETIVVNGLQRVRPGMEVLPTTVPMGQTEAPAKAAPARAGTG